MVRISRRRSDGILPHFAFSLLRVFAVDFFGLTRWNPITMLKSEKNFPIPPYKGGGERIARRIERHPIL